MLTSVILLSIVPFVAGEPHRAFCPNPNIKAVRGDGVTLPCHLVSEVHSSAYTWDWRRVDLDSQQVVHGCRGRRHHHAAQMGEYRGRTFLNCPDPSRGNLSLQISSVRPSDSGTYRCFVPALDASCTVHLTVVNEVHQNETETADSSTAGPPVTQQGRPDAAETEAGWKTGVPVAAGVVVLLLLIAGVIFIPKKCGKIQTIKTVCRGMKGREAETHDYEMVKKTETPEGDEDPPRADGAGLTDVVG